MSFDLVLFVGAFTAAAISGAAGFGGALLLLPLLVHSVGESQAVPLLTVAQFVGNLSRAGFGFSLIQWRPVSVFLLGALPLSVLGALSFVNLPKPLVVRAVGFALVAFAVLKAFDLVRVKAGLATLLIGGGVVGFLSGLVGSAGPLGAAIFLSLGLLPASYVASEAVTALAMHGVKTVVYSRYVPLDVPFWMQATYVSAAMVLGTWAAKQMLTKVSAPSFNRFVAAMVGFIGLYMIIAS